jgi:hypothetical protein
MSNLRNRLKNRQSKKKAINSFSLCKKLNPGTFPGFFYLNSEGETNPGFNSWRRIGRFNCCNRSLPEWN